ncbi:MAG TPA: nicotinate (nicotinamide) nucleotide adenylyltransferase [Rhizomicrobium sp.]|jgi:nicotinate-nucleotide adenylyltransferase|nr:nicotinate (nicotinamide) nucleotide adenylyltransferase [Rhizomicrobium sp.]
MWCAATDKHARDGTRPLNPPLNPKPHWITAPGPAGDGLRIGLLGGSFDPAHAGHLYVSEIARKLLKLDYVWWLVSPGNPLKPEPGALAGRLARARARARHHPFIRITDIEQRLGTRYTVDTVRRLKRRFPHARFFWLMGSDNLEQFARWRRWQEIARLIPIAVVRRPGSVLAPLHAPLARRLGVTRRLKPASSLVVLDGRRNWESSTTLRQQALGADAEAMINLTP